MMGKYYTPTVEEFHAGFEFEYKEVSITNPKGEWRSHVLSAPELYLGVKLCSSPDSLIWISSLITGGISPVRVKYIDEKDIEDLGGEQYVLEIDEKRVGTLRFKFNENKEDEEDFIIVRLYSKSLHRVEIWHTKGNLFFDGVIKNKSELRRVLIQTGIL